MSSLNKLLVDSAPKELSEFVSACASGDDLVKKLEANPSRLFPIIQNMNVEGNESLAARFLYRVSPNDLENPVVKKVETTLRNRDLLNRTSEPTISLKVEGGAPVEAHKSILALESPHFKAMAGFREFQDSKIEMEAMGLAPEVYQRVVEYLYLSDERRKGFVSTVNKELLLPMAQLSSYWGVDELKKLCDDELCNSLGEIAIEKSDMDAWLDQSEIVPKFTKLLGFVNRVAKSDNLFLRFINRVAGRGDLEPIISQMQTPDGAARLAAKCTQEEIGVFVTLKTEFGKACQIPPGTFGKAEWEKTFPVTIKDEDVPPLPPNIHAILEQEDPCEPGLKLKDTCQLFLRPEKVILHEKGGDKEVELGFDGVEELAKKATNVGRRTKYNTFVRDQMNTMSVEASGWVLMRKKLIPGTRRKNFADQQKLLRGSFEVPKTMDAILLNIIIYASEGRLLYGRDPWTYTHCQETHGGDQIIVGGFAPSGLNVFYYYFDYDDRGLSGAWKF